MAQNQADVGIFAGLPARTQMSMRDTNGNTKRNDLMKFIQEAEHARPHRLYGKRCFSNNSSVSKDSPDHFQPSTARNHIPDNKKPNPESQQRPNPLNKTFYPQKNYFDIKEQHPESSPDPEFLPEYMNTIELNSRAFNRKISDYSTFVNKNVSSLWGQTYPLMGIERSKEARKMRNTERDRLVDEKNRTRETFLRTFHSQRDSKRSNSMDRQAIRTNNDLLFSLRVKVRTNRNQMAKQLHMETESYLTRQASPTEKPDANSSTQLSTKPRPATGHNTSRLSRTQFFDTLLDKHGQHRKMHSTLESNIVAESKEQMNSGIQEWAQVHGDSKFVPVSSAIRKMDDLHRKIQGRTLGGFRDRN